jgi:predicted CXXCH cytochrome family protein
MAVLELLVVLGTLLACSVPLLSRTRHGGSHGSFAGILLLLVGIGWAIIRLPTGPDLSGSISATQKQQLIANPNTPVEKLVPRRQPAGEFQTSDRCRSCHPSEHASWHRTYHRSMTQLVRADNVLGDFETPPLQQGGLEYHFRREGDRFLVRMPDPDWYLATEGGALVPGSNVPIVELPVVMMTGSHSFQGYWVPSALGLKLIQLPWIYNIIDKRWMPSQDAFIRPPGGPRRVAVWNENCIQCHALGGNPRQQADGGPMMSTVAEMGISCEACHGPAEDHIAYYQNPLTRYLQHLSPGQPQKILNPARVSAEVSTEICGQCHSSYFPHAEIDYMTKGNPFRAGDSLAKTHHIIHYGDEDARAASREIADGGYWKDGAIRVGGREFNALVKSPCYTKASDPARQVSCLSCHSMHDSDPNDQLARQMDGDQACLQCHQPKQYAGTQHTHHEVGSSGSRCYNCHMPYTSYALLKGIRGHQVTVPSVNVSHRFQKPNACNQCHLDQTLAWTADKLEKWYDISSDPLDEDEKQIAASLLWITRGDAALRAITAWTYSWDAAREVSGDLWMAPVLAHTLDDPYAAVRYIAHSSLQKTGDFSQLGYDYVATDNHRQAARDQVLRHWSAVARPLDGELSQRCLLLPSGRSNQDRLLELIKQRDDTEQTWLPE